MIFLIGEELLVVDFFFDKYGNSFVVFHCETSLGAKCLLRRPKRVKLVLKEQ